ncbi:hypothetical protein ACWEQL_00260 [Kitasatospora sp. NPDC004240]
MIQIQLRGWGSTGSDYRFIGEPVVQWWSQHPAEPYLAWEQPCFVVESDGSEWKAALFDIQAHDDGAGRRTQFMLAFTGRSSEQADRTHLLRLLAHWLREVGDGIADSEVSRQLMSKFDENTVTRLRQWSKVTGGVPSDSADAAGREAYNNIAAAIQALPDVVDIHEARMKPGCAVGHVADEASRSSFVRFVSELTNGRPGTAVLGWQGIGDRAAATSALKVLAEHYPTAMILAPEDAEAFAYEGSIKFQHKPQKKIRDDDHRSAHGVFAAGDDREPDLSPAGPGGRQLASRSRGRMTIRSSGRQEVVELVPLSAGRGCLKLAVAGGGAVEVRSLDGGVAEITIRVEHDSPPMRMRSRETYDTGNTDWLTINAEADGTAVSLEVPVFLAWWERTPGRHVAGGDKNLLDWARALGGRGLRLFGG